MTRPSACSPRGAAGRAWAGSGSTPSTPDPGAAQRAGMGRRRRSTATRRTARASGHGSTWPGMPAGCTRMPMQATTRSPRPRAASRSRSSTSPAWRMRGGSCLRSTRRPNRPSLRRLCGGSASFMPSRRRSTVSRPSSATRRARRRASRCWRRCTPGCSSSDAGCRASRRSARRCSTRSIAGMR